MRDIASALLLLSAACVTRASGATPPPDVVASEPLRAPPEVLPNAAIQFSIQLGVHDEMIGRSPELALLPRGLYLQDDELRALHAVIVEHQPEGASVFGALSGPTSERMADANARFKAATKVFEQAFALDQPLADHLRLYIPANDSGALTKALVAWVETTFTAPVETMPNRACKADGSALCVHSGSRFIAVTDEKWGVRVDIASPLWPTLDDERVLEYSTRNAAERRERLAALRSRGYEDAFKATRTQIAEYWASAYAAPGLGDAPESTSTVTAAVDPHAVMRIAQARRLAPQYGYELGRALRQATEGLDDEPAAEYEFPELESSTDGLPISRYVAAWSFHGDARSIDFEWSLTETGSALLAAGDREARTPDLERLCVSTTACAAFSERFSGLLNVSALDPLSLQGSDTRYLMWPFILGAWPNVVAHLREALPVDTARADGSMAGALWRDGWRHVEFAVGSWSAEKPPRPVVSSGTKLPLKQGERYYTEETNFVIVDTPKSDRHGRIAASDLGRAAWLHELPTEAVSSDATVRLSDLLAVQRLLLGESQSSRWSKLSIDMALVGEVVRGHVALSGRREDVIQ